VGFIWEEVLTMNLYDFITTINEATLKDLEDAQKSITKLFPEFYSRVEAVRLSGGIRMVGKDERGWDFIVHSAKEDKWYPVRVNFDGVREVIAHHAKNKSLWTKDKGKINARSLAGEVMYNVDIKVKCGCPADLYWGSQYIRSQEPLDANFPPKEERPPVERNPKQHGSMCKHLQVVINLLPMYEGTFAKWLKEYFGADLTKTEQAARREGNELKDRAEEVQTEEEPKTEAERKAKEKTSESVDGVSSRDLGVTVTKIGNKKHFYVEHKTKNLTWSGVAEDALDAKNKARDSWESKSESVDENILRGSSSTDGGIRKVISDYFGGSEIKLNDLGDGNWEVFNRNGKVPGFVVRLIKGKYRFEKVTESRELRRLLFQKEGEKNV
jgi:hypothetical protein